MSEEILMNLTPRETRVAVVENGVVQEIYIERVSKRGLVGNIYVGKVVRVLPGMQAAFIEIGLERAAFLHLSDMISFEHEDGVDVPASGQASCISELLSEGQRLAVQVTKDPLGSKGARLTTRLSLASRFLVFMPELANVGVSQRIEDEEERERLREAVMTTLGDKPGGFIVRTASEGVDLSELKANQEYLRRYWDNIEKKLLLAKPGDVVHEDLPLFLRSLRDLVSHTTERIRIDSSSAHQKAVEFSDEFIPNIEAHIELYRNDRPIFDLYNVEDEIQKALQRKVSLKSGGHLVFDQTEAMTTIDVNTGAFVGHRNLEETIFKTNLEAASAIARQLRLRNLGGIIIIDFIDMIDEEHKRLVLRTLEKALAKDHAKNKISEVSSLGLVEMTRKRTQESLERVLCEPCLVCHGRGTLKTCETVCNEIFREVIRASKAYDSKSFLILASQEVVDRMLDEESSSVAELTDFVKSSIKFQVETLYTQEQFDVVLM